MKHFISISILSFVFLVPSFAQDDKKETDDTNITLPTNNIFNNSAYTIKCTILDQYVNEYILKKNSDDATKKTFVLNPNTLESFKENFKREFRALATDDTTVSAKATNDAAIEREATTLFYYYIASERAIESMDDTPEAGKICFNRTIKIERETISEDNIKVLVEDISKKISLQPSCQTSILIETPFKFRIPCILWRQSKESKPEWRYRIREYVLLTYDSALQSSINSEMRVFNDLKKAFAESKESIQEDSVQFNTVTEKIRELLERSNTVKSYVPRTTERIENEKKAIAASGLLSSSATASINFASQAAVSGLISNITSEETTLSTRKTVVETEIARLTTATNTSVAGSPERTTLQAQLTIHQNELKSIQNKLSELALLKTKVTTLNNMAVVLTDSSRVVNRLPSELISLRDDLARIQTVLASKNLVIDGFETQIKNSCAKLADLRGRLGYTNFIVSNIHVEFNDGFIENIVVEGNMEFQNGECMPVANQMKGFLKFNNTHPIGFSRKVDLLAYKRYVKLYAMNEDRTVFKVSLAKVFPEYIEKLAVDRKDFSPRNQIFDVDFKSNENCQTVKKEKTSKLFEAKIYTDFVGLGDDREPNGLVQTEISKQVYLNTYREKIGNKWKRRSTVGVFGYIEPEITISKIENNNRRLLLEIKDREVNNQYAPLRYASTLDLKRYQWLSVGFNLNLGILDLPKFKSTFYLDAGFRYGRTSIRDSLRTYKDSQIVHEKQATDFGVNTTEFYPMLGWEIKSDERYYFNFSYSHHWFFLRDNSFLQVANKDAFFLTEQNPHWINKEYSRIILFLSINPNTENDTKGKLFFRYQFYWQQGFWRTTFHQVQLGYSFYLLSRKS